MFCLTSSSLKSNMMSHTGSFMEGEHSFKYLPSSKSTQWAALYAQKCCDLSRQIKSNHSTDYLGSSQLSETKKRLQGTMNEGKKEKGTVTDKEASIIYTSCVCTGRMPLYIQQEKKTLYQVLFVFHRGFYFSGTHKKENHSLVLWVNVPTRPQGVVVITYLAFVQKCS